MKILIETLGCPKNFNDSEYAAGILENAGHSITDIIEEADVIIINTCGFINDAKVESIDRIFEFAGAKREDSILLVSGCLSQRYTDELFDEMPEVDIFIGVNDYDKLPEILETYEKANSDELTPARSVKSDEVYEKIESAEAADFYDVQMAENKKRNSSNRNASRNASRLKINSDPGKEFVELKYRKIKENPYTATLKIAEGCSNACSYCIIPQIRGPLRSRKKEEIIKEARILAMKGCKELILIAQDVAAYGEDLYGKPVLAQLLRDLCRIDGFEWIRLLYCYEEKITDELIDVIATEDKICKYIDIPLQHCSDHVLYDMNRASTGESIRNTIAKLRSKVPGIHVRTTLMTGFPGETEDDFQELYDFVQEMKFDRLGVFAFSSEEGTLAAEMPGQVPEDIGEERRDSIMRAQIEISLESNMKKIGSLMDVIVDGLEDGSPCQGHSEDGYDGGVACQSRSEDGYDGGVACQDHSEDSYDGGVACQRYSDGGGNCGIEDSGGCQGRGDGGSNGGTCQSGSRTDETDNLDGLGGREDGVASQGHGNGGSNGGSEAAGGTYIGRTAFDAPEIDNAVIFDSERPLKKGEIVKVRITDAFDYDLTGVLEEN